MLQDRWCQELAAEEQRYADTNNMQKFNESTKRMYGPTKRSIVSGRGADGHTLLRDKERTLKRWAEHFNKLLNNHTTSGQHAINEISVLPSREQLDLPPTILEEKEKVEGLEPR